VSFIVLSLEATKELALVYSPLITSTIVEPYSFQVEQAAIEPYQIAGRGKTSAELRHIKQLFVALRVVSDGSTSAFRGRTGS